MPNQIAVSGNVSQPPREAGDRAVVFSLAVDAGWGERKVTNFYSVWSFGKTKDYVMEHIGVGDKMFVTGELKCATREYNGKVQLQLDIAANTVHRVAAKGAATNAPSKKEEENFEDDIPF